MHAAQVRRRQGSIPACAGEPTSRPGSNAAIAVYPRVCGGTDRTAALSALAAGLSPRVRGNHRPPPQCPHRVRSIPACAGEPGCPVGLAPPWTVYPRVCGGTRFVPDASLENGGLSPRVRGNHCISLHVRGQEGSIPACAGEPRPGTPRPRPYSVYPRVCGGTQAASSKPLAQYGLSPRVRGNRRALARNEARTGSIPACAGEPPCHPSRPPNARVYPRVCGGTSRHAATPICRIGLSPRVRGNLRFAQEHEGAVRSIPACAGEPYPHPGAPSSCRVYPRVCGGT